ncbi:MAG TPA: ATP-binding protein [Stellaceae bacterium]|nr:ATP-binding protein [Stellaceae bacterium]
MPLPSLMSKSLGDLTLEDIQALCDEGTLEDQYIDFKENLSERRDSGASWNAGNDAIAPRAVNALARVAVAFANAEGGWIVLGVREDGAPPSRASEILPLRACHDLARRLRQSLYARIDPVPTGLDVRGIETTGDGAGVVVIRAPASPYAPHGVISDNGRECYLRRNDECRPMTMRDIQERTLEIERGLASLHATFAEQRREFENLEALPGDVLAAAIPVVESFMGCIITAVPTRGGLSLDKPYRRDWAAYCRRDWIARDQGAREHLLYSHLDTAVGFRPTLRGAIARYATQTLVRQLVITSSGVISYAYKDFENLQGIFLGWVGGDVLNILKIVDAFRQIVGQADAEYALAVRLEKRGANDFALAPFGVHNFGFQDGTLRSPVDLPIWRVGSTPEFGDTVLGVMNDVCNAAGWESLDGWSIPLHR